MKPPGRWARGKPGMNRDRGPILLGARARRASWKAWVRWAFALLGAALLAVFVIFGLLSGPPDTQIDARLSEQRAARAPAFSLPVLAHGSLPSGFPPSLRDALDRRQASLGELRGVPVVLNLWASWCHPCREEAPVLAAGWRREASRGILYLGLNMEDSEGAAREFLTKYGIAYPVVRDGGAGVARSFGAAGIPETYFLDPAGKIVAHVIGALSPESLAEGAQAARSGLVLGIIAGGDLRSPR